MREFSGDNLAQFIGIGVQIVKRPVLTEDFSSAEIGIITDIDYDVEGYDCFIIVFDKKFIAIPIFLAPYTLFFDRSDNPLSHFFTQPNHEPDIVH